MKRALLYLLKTYTATVLLFIAAKVVFMLCNGGGHDLTMGDYADVVGHGLSLDLSTALYILIVPFLVCMLSTWVGVSKWVLRVYNAIVALALALAFVADSSLYPFWGFKLDASCMQYLSQPEGITQSVSVGYLLLRVVLVAIVAVGIYYLLSLLTPSFKGQEKTGLSERASAKSTMPALKRRLAETVVYVLLIPLLVIGIRGGLSESTTNIGQVYFSQNQFLNHAAVNPVFSFLYSASHQLGDLSQYHFMDDAECQRLLTGVYTTESLLTDTLLTTARPHLLIILLESSGEEFAAAMPHLQQLKQEGVSFSQCYGNSWRTDRGTVCALSGYPSFPSVSVMKMPQKSRSLPGIARTLKAQGYQTTYVYGGDINFTNMRSYLIATGWEHLVSMDDYSTEERNSAQWGVRDDITFETIYQQICQLSPGHPQLIGYSTLSSHEPWDVPQAAGRWAAQDDEVLNAFAYLDYCLWNFVEKVRTTPAWENLLIVITADHGINYKQTDQQTPLLKNHIPMLWIGGAVREPRDIGLLCNQSDMAATLLGQLQLDHSDFAFSRDVLSATYSHPTAVHNYNNAQLLIDSTGHILYDFDARRLIIDHSNNAEGLLRLNQAILQRTTADLSTLDVLRH